MIDREKFRRRIKTISVALSATLMVLCLAVMALSYTRQIEFEVRFNRPASTGSRWCYIAMTATHGRIGLTWDEFGVTYPHISEWNFERSTRSVDYGVFADQAAWGKAGFGGWYDSYPINGTGVESGLRSGVFCPIWLVALGFSIAPAVSWRRLRIDRNRRRSGLCLACGYDLRGSTDRCPECGRLISATSSAIR